MKAYLRKVFAVTFMLCASLFAVNAQTLQEVVYLKNGSVIKGTIIEQIPNESLKIKTRDGSVFAYKMNEVEKITKETAEYKYSGNSLRINGKGRQIGYRGFIDLGYTLRKGELKSYGNRLEVSTSHGYQFNPYFFAGVGIGFNYYHKLKNLYDEWTWDGGYNYKGIEMPVFAHFRSEFLNNFISPFLDFKIGYTAYDFEGFYMSPTVGCRVSTSKATGISLGLGYSMQKLKGESIGGSEYDFKENIGGFTVRLGFDF